MYTLSGIVIIIFTALTTVIQCQDPKQNSSLAERFKFISESDGLNIFENLLTDIQRERPIDAMLIIHQSYASDSRLGVFYQWAGPKVIITKDRAFGYKKKFNSEILAVLMMTNTLDLELLEAASQSMDFMRQSRILVVAINVDNHTLFKVEFLKPAQNYRMTNVLLYFFHTNDSMSSQYHALKPYPHYHWHEESLEGNQNGDYYPQHWRNMHNATLITYSAQNAPQSLVYEEPAGKLKMNGFVSRLVMLFAEHYNASLQMYEPLKVGEAIHFSYVNKLTYEHKLDIPMVLDTGFQDKFQYMSVTYDVIHVLAIVPCARPMTIREVFSILLNVDFFGCVIICTLLLSIAHSLIDYYFDGLWNRLNFVISAHVLPGVLGQSFAARNAPWRCLKIVYLLLFFAGLNISTQFGANVNSLFTSLPYFQQIETLDELLHSPVKILLDDLEAKNISDIMPKIEKSCIVTTNSTYVVEMRNSFNTSFAYVLFSTGWDVYTRQQQYFTYKKLCTSKHLLLYDSMPFAVRLQLHTPYKEPMDYLIHRVHELGLMDAWKTSTFMDMLKLKRVSIRDPNPPIGRRVFTANDFFWIWMIVVVGLAVSSLVFVLELLIGHRKS